MQSLEVLETIITKGKLILKSDEQDYDRFTEQVTDYLESLDAWQKAYQADPKVPDAEHAHFAQLVNTLNELHQQIVVKATAKKDEVASQMGDVYKRAQVLKKYIDRYPSRITITGRRKG